MSTTSGIFSYNSSYNSTTSLLNSMYGSSSSKSASSISSILSNTYGFSTAFGTSYGTNTSSVSTEISSFLTSVKSASNSINSAMDKLQSSSTWKDKSLNSDNTAVSVKYTGKETLKDMTVDVKQVAKAQSNEGKDYYSDISTLSTIASGKSFTIDTADGKSQTFTVSSSGSNEDFQNAVASKINSAKLGVTAKVEVDDKKGTSKLVITGDKTGEGNDFTISGELADKLGISTVSQKAQNSIYSINGGESQTSSTNEIKYSDDLTITLNSATEKSAKISYSTNTDTAISNFDNLIAGYNSLLKTVKQKSGVASSYFENRLNNLTSTYSKSLKALGVEKDSDGYLKIKSSTLQEAANNGTLEKFFTEENPSGGNYGFANRLNGLASKISEDPTQYLSQDAKTVLNATADPTSGYYSASESSKMLKAYLNYNSTSTLFNALF